jgi:AcrR family transcriptional regulator
MGQVASVTAETRQNQLSEEEVVLATLRLIENDGISRLSMRRLAELLGVTPMAIYYYVHNKEQLLELVSDRLLSQIGGDDSGAWQERLLDHGVRMWDVLTQYPGFAAFILSRPMSEQSKRGASRIRTLLEEAGFDRVTADLAFQSWHVYTYGLIAMDTNFHSTRQSWSARRRAIVFGLQTWIFGLEAQWANGNRP